MKKLIAIVIFAIFILSTILTATALEIKKEVIFETYNGTNQYQFFQDETITNITIDTQNITLDSNIRYAIDTNGTPVNMKIVDIVFPYDIIDITSQEKFKSDNVVTSINPSYFFYYIINPKQDAYLSVISKEDGIKPIDKMKMATIILLTTAMLTTLVLLVRRKKKREKQENI